jgi:hypothetical protein
MKSDMSMNFPDKFGTALSESAAWEPTVEGLHGLIADEQDVSNRMRKIAESFLGAPYVPSPLVGGPNEPEKLVVGFDAFDCVTFVETALALARSSSATGFITELTRTRYRDGLVDWHSRLHYFSDWLSWNEERGAVEIRTTGPGSRSIEANLGLIEGLPARRVRFHVVPKRSIRLASLRISNGAIVAFASVRSRLDFYHVGLLFSRSEDGRPGDETLLYQAARSAGKVFAEPLKDFLGRNRMRGIAFAAPRAPGEPICHP